jgi:tRNA 2-selenouridine synthase SelU
MNFSWLLSFLLFIHEHFTVCISEHSLSKFFVQILTNSYIFQITWSMILIASTGATKNIVSQTLRGGICLNLYINKSSSSFGDG